MKTYTVERAYLHWLNRQRDVNGLSTDQIALIKQAFYSGAQSMAGETLCILNDWACACSGLEPEPIEPSTVYDRAAENLNYYYTELGIYNAV